MECVTTVNYTVLVNGETTKPFDVARGLRQGDPMSPFLFAIAMEYLSRNLKTLKQEKAYHFHPLCERLDLTHLSFADDLLIFARGDATSPLIDKIVARISSWTVKKLSYAGRIQLVQHVIFGIQSYWAQIFIMPAKVVKTIETYCIREADWRDAKDSMEGSNVSESGQARPKVVFILWLLMHGRLQTADRLKKWKIQVDEICCFCKQALETKEHIFAECVAENCGADSCNGFKCKLVYLHGQSGNNG
ncbi:uncharacterized protein LOC142172559 [Nicotiana tabacum]|uniref:Uncharacterized protein LOC142172559 n=1 Tax=Nicotiana tabacum TaxID=4097 RepID=A0AC58T504_TOBAC